MDAPQCVATQGNPWKGPRKSHTQDPGSIGNSTSNPDTACSYQWPRSASAPHVALDLVHIAWPWRALCSRCRDPSPCNLGLGPQLEVLPADTRYLKCRPTRNPRTHQILGMQKADGLRQKPKLLTPRPSFFS